MTDPKPNSLAVAPSRFLTFLRIWTGTKKLSQVRGALVAKLSEFAAAAGPEALTAALAPLRVGSLAECEALLHSLRAPGFAL